MIVLGKDAFKRGAFLKEAVCKLKDKFDNLLIVHVPRYKKRLRVLEKDIFKMG